MNNYWLEKMREEEINKIIEKFKNNPDDLTELDFVILNSRPWKPSKLGTSQP